MTRSANPTIMSPPAFLNMSSINVVSKPRRHSNIVCRGVTCIISNTRQPHNMKAWVLHHAPIVRARQIDIVGTVVGTLRRRSASRLGAIFGGVAVFSTMLRARDDDVNAAFTNKGVAVMKAKFDWICHLNNHVTSYILQHKQHHLRQQTTSSQQHGVGRCDMHHLAYAPLTST